MNYLFCLTKYFKFSIDFDSQRVLNIYCVFFSVSFFLTQLMNCSIFFYLFVAGIAGIISSFSTLNPLNPHDVLKHLFTYLKTDVFFLKLRGFRRKISMEISMKLLSIHGNFLKFFTHFKSSSSTTSRELRQQFPACSG